jgi:hypothetical protein
MKKTLSLALLVLVFSCKPSTVKRPDNLIGESQMVDMLYDLALLEAIRTQQPVKLEAQGLTPDTYIYKKYKVDSLQFAQSNQYYAADIEKYKKLYDRVEERLQKNKKTVDSIMQANGIRVQTPDASQGVVR